MAKYAVFAKCDRADGDYIELFETEAEVRDSLITDLEEAHANMTNDWESTRGRFDRMTTDELFKYVLDEVPEEYEDWGYAFVQFIITGTDLKISEKNKIHFIRHPMTEGQIPMRFMPGKTRTIFGIPFLVGIFQNGTVIGDDDDDDFERIENLYGVPFAFTLVSERTLYDGETVSRYFGYECPPLIPVEMMLKTIARYAPTFHCQYVG